MPAHQFADPQDVLAAVKQRMVGTLRNADPSNVVITQKPQQEPPTIVPSRNYWTLTFGSGTFDSGAWDGAGRETLIDSLQLIVGIFDANDLDLPDRDELALLAENYGATWKIRELLASLAGWNAVDPNDPALMLLAEPLKPIDHQTPIRTKSDYFEGYVTFHAKFCWQLGEMPL